jgi:uncharacterized LabA/DUF88 family protein
MKLGIYQHYKGNNYHVIGVARHSETLEEMVVYQALYEHPDYGTNSLRVRPKQMFLENVTRDGKTTKGNVDIDIALEVAKDHFENRLQSGFLVTADWDYNSLVKFLKEKEKLAKVIIPGTHDTSRFLTRAAGNAVHDIGNLKHILSQ